MLSFPPELYILAFDHLPLSSLANLSLCSHQFRILAFPFLYRKVVLTEDKPMARFALRVIKEEGPSWTRKNYLHAAKYVKCLCIGPEEGLYSTNTLHLLASAIPYLTHLKDLVWVASTSGDSQIASIFTLIREHCLDFDSLSLKLNWNGHDDEHLDSVLGFKGLQHLRLSAHDTMFGKLPSAMIDMIRLSPDLVTLELCVTKSYGHRYTSWDADKSFESILRTRYPRLQCLRLQGARWIDLHRLASDTSALSGPFHSFLLLNHRNIVTLTMPIPINDSQRGLDDLRLPKDIFPNLREFEGTISWCFYISGLHYPATCLRRMNFLRQPRLHEEGRELVFNRAYCALNSCLALRELNVFCNGTAVTADRIAQLLEHAPGLHTLECHIDDDETLESISTALGKFGALRFLAFNLSDFHHQADDALFALAKNCPTLTGVKDFRKWDPVCQMFDE
ncbi:hypothetical protein FPV67DRAFT_1523062 [Lyophyllum atratum]|nr:hypothetical protein FPV67DRAFT_1523062 [Lyophyllum atratum]